MLVRLEIHDFALFDHVVLEPCSGLTVLTGETGAGKSILIDALGAIAGGRTTRDMIRSGADSARIEALFRPPDGMAGETFLERYGVELSEGDDLFLGREISSGGRNLCRINGRLVPLSTLREVAERLLDIHGQNENQMIFRTETHRVLLDRYAGPGLQMALDPYLIGISEHQDILKSMLALGSDPAGRERAMDILTYQLAEIEAADLSPGEDDRLQERRRVVSAAERIRDALAEAYERIEADPDGLLSNLTALGSRLDGTSRILSACRPVTDKIAEAQVLVQEAAQEIRALLDRLRVEPGELERLDERLDLLTRLKKKYGGTLEAVRAFAERASSELEALASAEGQMADLQRRKEALEAKLARLAAVLTEIRTRTGRLLSDRMARSLSGLGMKDVRFQVDVRPDGSGPSNPGRTGFDQVEFLIAPNPGEPMRPLQRIASGGEAARTMLALKTLLASADAIPLLIFDEVDSGVSGRTARAVAERLSDTSRHHQVLCVTHQAPIAAMADEQVLIEKLTDGGRTRTRLVPLEAEGRRREVARLLAGGEVGSVALELADQMLADSRQYRTAAAAASP